MSRNRRRARVKGTVRVGGATILLLCAGLCLSVEATWAGEGEPVRLESVRKIWDAAPHNAFTDLIRHRDRWLCVFREGARHVSPEAGIRVIVSEDGERWESAAFIEEEGVDLRDPKLSVAPDGRLVLLGGWRQWPPDHEKSLRSWVAFSEDGHEWTRPRKVLAEGEWLWRITWHQGRAFGVAYGPRDGSADKRTWSSRLYSSSDALEFEPVTNFSMRPGLTEATLRFGGDGTAYCIHRRDAETRTALLGTASPPYEEWTWRDTGFYLGGPNVIRHQGCWYAAGRWMVGPPVTVLARVDWGAGTLEPVLRLPSGGDTSYPGLVSHEGLLWMSYYASHEGKSAIYLARVRLPAASGPADVPGPDGILYPDWRRVGVPGGIPDVPVKVRLADFGGRPDDGRDDAEALERAAARAGSLGGGAVLLEEGVYHLDRPVIITRSGVVLRGSGPEGTRIVNRYAGPEKKVGFLLPRDGETVGPGDWIEIHCRPDGLKAIRLLAGEKTVAERERGAHWGGTFRMRATGAGVLRAAGAGEQTLEARAEYDDGSTARATIRIRVDPQRECTKPPPRYLGAITFVGRDGFGKRFRLARDGRRGDTELEVEDARGLGEDMRVLITAPATKRWNELVANKCRWGTYRMNQYRIESVEGTTVRIEQPLRIDFPAIDGSYLQEIAPILHCGVEDLALEQTEKLWMSGVIFSSAWECWVRNVRVRKAGRWAIYTSPAKWCEIRDCRVEDAWYHGGGGTAYVGFECAFDCLMEGMQATRMRHAPCFQWGASGNVIRRSRFIQSDGQWHAGWTNENLIELCEIDAQRGTGSYGHGFWASPPEDTAHGPNGPRNVVYNCDVKAPRSGLWMGGMNHGWLFLHNRVVCGEGPAVFLKTNSDGHLIRDNTFVVLSEKAPGLVIGTDDSDGVRFEENRVYGATALTGGKGKALSTEGSVVLPLDEDATPQRPRPAVESIFEWQRGG